MASEEHVFHLRYQGEDVSEGLEPTAFAEALKGFSDFISTVSEAAPGADEDSKLRIRRVSQGSLVIEIVQSLGDATVNDLLAASASVLPEIKRVFELLEFLGGKPPHSLQPTQDNNISVTNNSGNVTVINASTVNLVLNRDIGSQAERFALPVKAGKADGFAIEMDGDNIANINHNDAANLVSVARDIDLSESESQMWLTARKVVFDAEAGWAFSDGKRTFTAKISDEGFLRKVREGRERFGNGDRFHVRLKTKQSRRGSTIKTKYEIMQVVHHERWSDTGQASLF